MLQIPNYCYIMKKTASLLIALLLLGLNHVTAQTPGNALNFDGADDYVSAPLPAVFNNIPGNDFTIEAWIKPTATAFSRVIFAQLNTSNFVSVSMSSSNQVYFYVSNVVGFNTTASLPLGVWSHVACTWDASTSTVEIFINGISTPIVNGGTSSTGNDNIMTIGTRTNLAQFFTGELDEIRIWDDLRTPCEIAATMSSEFTMAQPNLIAYYNFNQGVAGGSNGGVTALPDFTTNYNGTLSGFTLSGSSSNWIASGANINAVNQNTTVVNGTDTRTECNSYTWIDGNTYTSSNNTATHTITGGSVSGCDSLVTLDLTIVNPTSGTDIVTECNSFTWIDGNTYTANNNTATYNIVGGAANGCDSLVTLDLTILNSTTGTDVITECYSYTWIDGNTYTSSNNSATFNIVGGAANGCDSLVTLTLTIDTVSDFSTSVSGNTISANNTAATYQWLDCDNGSAIIPGETGATFTPTANGNYAVQLTENGCVDTSACVAITTIGILENSFGEALKVYPNPTRGNFSVRLGESLETVTVTITDINGRQIQNSDFSNTDQLNLTISEPSGVYLVTIQSGEKRAVVRLVKN